MRIDTTLLPQAAGLVTVPGLDRPGASFDSFFSMAEGGDKDAGVKAAPVLSSNVFGFDALGVLGLGGPAGAGVPLGFTPGDTKASAGTSPDARAPAPVMPVHASIPHVAISSPPVAQMSATQTPVVSSITTDAVSRPADVPALRAAAPPTAALPVFTTQSWSAAAGPQVVSQTAPVISAGRLAFSSLAAGGGDNEPEIQAPRKSPPAARFGPDAETAASQVSISLSEGEDALHVVAAAPDLTETDRHALGLVADEAAAEAGITLGELRLNGVVVRPFTKTR